MVTILKGIENNKIKIVYNITIRGNYSPAFQTKIPPKEKEAANINTFF